MIGILPHKVHETEGCAYEVHHISWLTEVGRVCELEPSNRLQMQVSRLRLESYTTRKHMVAGPDMSNI